MKKLTTLLLLASLNIWAAEKVNFKMVTELSSIEPYGAQLYHADTLWVGRSREKMDSLYQLEAYASNGSLRGSVTLGHSAQFIYPYSANSVLVTGNTPYPTHTVMSVVAFQNGALKTVKSKTWPLDVNVYHFARTSDGREFFGAPGGSLNQPPLNPGEPAPMGVESILVVQGSGYTFLKPQLKFLQQILGVGKYLFVYEGGPMTGDENIARVDPSSQTAKRAFKFGQYFGMGFPIQFDASTVAVPVRQTNEVLLVDVETLALKKSLPIAAGTPRAVAKVGKCIVAASQDSKKVTFVNAETGEQVAEWDFGSAAGQKLFGLKALSIDAASKTVFVRSAFPGNPMTGPTGPERNSVWMAKGENDETFNACK